MKILIIQIRQLGDVLLSTPLAECIKKNIDNSEVHFLTSSNSYDILEGNPFIDKIILLDNGIFNEISILKNIRINKYDAIIDVQRTGRSKRLTGFSNAKLKIGFEKSSGNGFYNYLVKPEDTGYVVTDRFELLKPLGIRGCREIYPYLHIDKQSMDESELLLNENKINRFILFAPTARRIRKMLPPEKFKKLVYNLCYHFNTKAIITYGKGEEKIVDDFVRGLNVDYFLPENPLKIKVLAALISKSFLFVGNNSFSGHVALTQNINSVIFSGPEVQWFPKNKVNCLIINDYDFCISCPYEFDCKKDKEESDYLKCFKETDVEKVFDKIVNHFGKNL
jgi:ADP-heptose:LPS heptosyltransferase